MRYKRNYLSHVILQLKFEPIASLRQERPESFQRRIATRFPTLREGEETEISWSLSPDKVFKSEMKSVRHKWTFFSKDELRLLTVASNEFTLEYKKYDSIAQTMEDFSFAWGSFCSDYTVTSLERIGLRYINQIALPTGDCLDWKGYIDERILASCLQIPAPNCDRLTRSMHEAHWIDGDHRLLFRFGVWNRDFPNPVSAREFVLDYDCFSVGPVEPTAGADCLRRYNKIIEGLFEASIGRKLRSEMGVMKGSEDTVSRGPTNEQ